MAVHSLKTVQLIPAPVSEAWPFFADPSNLAAITPAYLDFNIVSKHHGRTMYAGQIIEYTIKPLLRVPLYWMTEITHVETEKYFVDEQRFGPYSLWHHQHHFKPVDGGVEMTDLVHYKMPVGPAGRFANRLFVRQQLQSIFSYRFKKVEERFGAWPHAQQTEIEFS